MKTKLLLPHFFILGAPKCGTTSMTSYLGNHPGIHFSHPKEPNFFNTDFSKSHRRYHSIENYSKECFPAISSQLLRGEGTVWYLCSETAVPNILKVIPEAKFIVMLRDPFELIPSLHSTLLRSLQEDVEDLNMAWGLERKRANGRFIPNDCRDSKLLAYGNIARLGYQLKRLYQAVEKDKVHLIWFEDLVSNTRATYQSTLKFLELDDDNRCEFEQYNRKRSIRSRLIARIIDNLARLPGMATLKRRMGLPLGKGPIRVLNKLNTTAASESKVPDELAEKIRTRLQDDISLLENLTGRDLSHWLGK